MGGLRYCMSVLFVCYSLGVDWLVFVANTVLAVVCLYLLRFESMGVLILDNNDVFWEKLGLGLGVLM